jgi:hypothetical protein
MLNGSLFWFAMGILFVLVAWAFKTFADDRGWRLSWWKGLLAILWYAILSLSFFAWGTLVGEGEPSAGFKLLLIGLFVSIVFGAGLLRLLMHRSKTPVQQ